MMVGGWREVTKSTCAPAVNTIRVNISHLSPLSKPPSASSIASSPSSSSSSLQRWLRQILYTNFSLWLHLSIEKLINSSTKRLQFEQFRQFGQFFFLGKLNEDNTSHHSVIIVRGREGGRLIWLKGGNWSRPEANTD